MSGIDIVPLEDLLGKKHFQKDKLCIFVRIKGQSDVNFFKLMVQQSKKNKKITFYCTDVQIGAKVYGIEIKDSFTVVCVKDCKHSFSADGKDQIALEESLKKFNKA